MKTMIRIAMAMALVLAVVSMARAAETTLSGTMLCAKCALKKADATKCQDVLVVKDDKGTSTEYYIAKNEVAESELGTKLKAIVEANPDQEVFLTADGKVPYEKVAQLLALCTQAGVPRMGMVTQPGKPTQ